MSNTVEAIGIKPAPAGEMMLEEMNSQEIITQEIADEDLSDVSGGGAKVKVGVVIEF